MRGMPRDSEKPKLDMIGKRQKIARKTPLRSFPITLPKLASPSEKNSALLAGDWLTQIKPLISEVSSKAGAWWDTVLHRTMEKYRQWLEAGPLDRLRIQPPEEHDLPQGYGRLVQRVTTMMLAAVPDELRGELISTRQLSPQGILFGPEVLPTWSLGERSSDPSGAHEHEEAAQQRQQWTP